MIVLKVLVKSWLFVFDAEFTVNCSEYALHLSHGEHAAKEGVAGIVSTLVIAEHFHAVVNAHRQLRVGFLENTCQFYDIGASAQVRCFGEVAVGENVAGTQVYEPCA